MAERYLIVSGKGRVELGGQDPVDVCQGDVVRIPPGVSQRIANIGEGDLLFYCICTPPFRQDCYETRNESVYMPFCRIKPLMRSCRAKMRSISDPFVSCSFRSISCEMVSFSLLHR